MPTESAPSPNCKECPFAAEDGKPAHNPLHGSRARVEAKGVLVTECPSEDDVKHRACLSGRSGQALDALLTENTLNRGALHVVPACACKAPKGKFSDANLKKAADCCEPLFRTQFDSMNGHTLPVLALGKSAAYAVLRARTQRGRPLKMNDARGFVRDSNVVATWSPGFALFYAPREAGNFEVDVSRFCRLVRGTLLHAEPRIVPNAGLGDLNALLASTTEHELALDIECWPESSEEPWTGKDPLRARLRRIGLGTERFGVSFTWHDLRTQRALRERVQEILSDPTWTKVLHNGDWYDARVLERYGYALVNTRDTRDERRAVSATSKLSLRYLGSIYTDIPPWKEGEEDDAKGLVFTPDETKLGTYNAMDCVVTARVARGVKSEAEWGEPRVQRLHSVHRELSRIAAKMNTVGFGVDQARREELANELEELANNRKSAMLAAVGDKQFTGTPDEMRALLFKRHARAGMRCFELPDPTNPKFWADEQHTKIAVDRGHLLSILVAPTTPEELRRIIHTYWHAHAPRKARSTYVSGDAVQQAIGPDGRLRAGWNSCGTETMRWSCSSPNLMNLSEKKDGLQLSGELPNMRSMYRAAKGKVLVHADYSQQELRVMRAVAHDDVLGQAIDSGDVYSFDARNWFGLDASINVKKEKPAIRKACKIIHLGFQYGAGTGTVFTQALMQDQTFSYSQARVLHDAAKKSYHRTVSYWFEEMEQVKLLGYSQGRILDGRRYYSAEPDLSEVANFPIQRTAGELTALAMIKLEQALHQVPGANIVTIQHDAFDVECWAKDAGVVQRIYEDVMPGPWTIDGKPHLFPVEVKAGEHWSDV